MTETEELYQYIDERKQKLLDGGVNCIPTPFPTFKYDYPGVELGTYYLISGASKSSKSKITNFLFLFNTILYAYNNPDKVRLKIFYALLEETKKNITLKFLCYLLFELSGHRIRVDIKTLKSVDESRMISDEVRNQLDTMKYKSILDFYYSHVNFIPDRNPTGIFNTLEKYAHEHGKIVKRWNDDLKKEVFHHYEPDDPDEYVICIVDHVGIISTERGFDLRESINKLSEYLKICRNKYNYIPVVVQQQNSETLSLDAFKANKIRPTQKGCADSQGPPKDCDIMIGITNPYSFEMKKYPFPDLPNSPYNYDITRLKGYARFLEIVLGRDGESNAVLGLYFDGATGYYAPLPKADNLTELNKKYQLIQRIQESISK